MTYEVSDSGIGLFTAEERAFRAEVRAWLEDNPPPATARDGLHADVLSSQVAWERRLHAAGFGALHWPAEYGGRALPMTYQLILAEELARARVMPFRHRPTIVGMFMAGPFIIAVGSDEQRRDHLPRILNLETLWCQLFSEPDAGSDLASLRTTARRDGDHLVINGQKIWNSYAHLADMGVLLARTDPHVPKHQGLTVFLLDMKLPGITVRPLQQANGGAEFNEVFFDEVEVPADAVIGGIDNGWRSITTFLTQERSALQLGSYAEMLLEAGAIVDTVSKEGASPVRLDQLMLAWSGLMIQRWTALSIAAQAERGVPSAARSSLGKLQWAQNLQGLALANVGLLGGRSIAWTTGEVDIELAVHSLLSSRSASIAGGTSEIQKNLLAERVLELPR